MTTDALPSIDQARRGGCCICQLGCDGIDGVTPCSMICAFCMNGCPAPATRTGLGACDCVDLPQTKDHPNA